MRFAQHPSLAAAEKKLAAKEDLKLTDVLRYHEADSIAAKDLMYRRIKAYQKKDETTKALDSARAKQKKLSEAETNHKTATEIKAAIDKTARPGAGLTTLHSTQRPWRRPLPQSPSARFPVRTPPAAHLICDTSMPPPVALLPHAPRCARHRAAELETFKKRRFAAFRKGLIQYTQNQIRQAKEETVLWTETLAALKAGM